ELEKLMPGSCYDRSSGKRKPRQTPREDIPVKDILFPYIQFEHKEFNRVLEWFRGHTIVNTKGDLDLSCTINNFEFIFGSGGIHGSVSSQIVQSDDINTIIDIDVASYYPNLAIENRLYPEHLGERYCDVYKDVYEQRKSYRKGTAENAMLKLALNGTYGDSNNKYSPFYDPKYTMSITINGQLLLCMLAEQLMKTASVEMIQINTDGLTIKCPRTIVPWVKEIMSWWEDVTKLELEMAEYNRMMIRDVNNYIAEYTDNKLKRKGAYEHERGWHQQHSSLVVQKAAEAKLVHGVDVRDFIEDHKDIMDFMLNTKVPRSSKLVYVDYEDKDHLLQNVTRYYISNLGGSLIKIMPPTKTMIKAGNTADRRIGINTSWKVTPCNDIKDCRPEEIEFDYYIQEANKLVEPLLEG
ncbi:hypothetical protein KAR91_06970, partial [Candidatus Pacearchaeota archaeon]|nr:hypothetical protein [Candidatus Pacearchaeota archaeon]